MIRFPNRFTPVALAVTALLPLTLAAQPPTPAISPAMDRAIARARAALDTGDGAEARAVLDSLVTVAPTGSDDLAEALFWRATLAERLSEAERDWKRLVIEMPLAPRAGDALMRLGELDMLRGHPADARAYFARVVREYPVGPATARGQLWIAKSWMAQGDQPRACVALAEAVATGVPEGELRLQADEMGRQCATVDRSRIAKVMAERASPGTVTTAAATTASATTASAAPTPTAAPKTNATPAPEAPARPADIPTGARFSVQVAAFETRDEGERLVKRLNARGIKARVDGSEKPFRVRVGYFGARAGATAELARLKKGGLSGFVAEIAK